jgi:hypothetical protein
MTERIAKNFLHKITTGTVKVALTSLLTISILAQPLHAVEQEWWFDVEVILFKRNIDMATISEKFKQSQLETQKKDVIDLLTPYLNPDLSYLRAGLPYCRVSKRLAVQKQNEQDYAFPLPGTEITDLSLPQPNEKQQQQTEHVLAGKFVGESDEKLEKVSKNITVDNFQYAVSTADIFAQSDDTILLAQTTDTISPPGLEKISSGNVDQQTNIELAANVYVPGPPIKVEFIEWQIPSEFLCSYAEQIDPSFTSTSITWLQNDVSDKQPSKLIERVPEIINGTEWQQKRGAFLLPTSTTHMSELYNKIKRQRDITPILHLNWRQEVKFGRDKGQTFRLFAGENFAQQFDVNGLPLDDDTDSLFDNLHPLTVERYIPEQELVGLTSEQQQTLTTDLTGTDSVGVTEDLFAQIDAALTDDTPFNIDQVDVQFDVQIEQQTAHTDPAVLKELWQLDGGIKVYLRNIGRVPYLHIDSNLDFRQPMFDPAKAAQKHDFSEQGTVAINQILQPGFVKPDNLQTNFLHSVNFNQLRRVISKQVHYFDHPLFGMVVRINRYKWPEIPSEDVDTSTQDN